MPAPPFHVYMCICTYARECTCVCLHIWYMMHSDTWRVRMTGRIKRASMQTPIVLTIGRYVGSHQYNIHIYTCIYTRGTHTGGPLGMCILSTLLSQKHLFLQTSPQLKDGEHAHMNTHTRMQITCIYICTTATLMLANNDNLSTIYMHTCVIIYTYDAYNIHTNTRIYWFKPGIHLMYIYISIDVYIHMYVSAQQ